MSGGAGSRSSIGLLSWSLLLLLLLLCFVSFCDGFEKSLSTPPISSTPVKTQISAVQGLISRRFGAQYVNQITLTISKAESKDYFMIGPSRDSGANVNITAPNGVSLASGLYWYLRYSCNASFTWGASNQNFSKIQLPSRLPLPTGTTTVSSPVAYRYYYNTCTHSYSAVWWDWARWEEEIDWMALHGINLPLSFTGAEYSFRQLFREFGLTDNEIYQFFSGPAFLTWQRMGNIKGWAGPLGDHWIEQQMILQKQIVARQREMGMTTVLPGFAGFVPDAWVKKYPDSNVTQSSNWNRFPKEYSYVYLLQPLDKRFYELGKRFIQVQTSIYGTDHYYNADTFNELVPSSGDLNYLKQTSAAVYKGMREADPESVWLMQGWLFVDDPSFWTAARVEAYLSGVENNQMLILDLYADEVPVWKRTNSFYKKPFVWCLLHNFGGRRGLYGNLQRYMDDILATEADPNATIVGLGLTPEAIEQNPIVYELAIEMTWRKQSFNMDSWVSQYARSRYGIQDDKNNSFILSAWQLLKQGAYSTSRFTTDRIELTPNANIGNMWPGKPEIDATLISAAWNYFIQSIKQLSTSSGINQAWRYDCVDVSRQVLSDLFYDAYGLWLQAIQRKDALSVASTGVAMLQIIKDMDQILATNDGYLLGVWLNKAKLWGNTSNEIASLEFNARNQITLWGPVGQINTYAAKHWAGLVGDFYYRGWEMITQQVYDALKNGQTFDQNKFFADLFNYQDKWGNSNNVYPDYEIGQTEVVAPEIWTKYNTMKAGQYQEYPNTQIEGQDLGVALWTKHPSQLAFLCNIEPRCLAVDTLGIMKRTITSFKTKPGVNSYKRNGRAGISTTTN